MIEKLDSFLHTLSTAGIDPNVEEIRDALWLSAHFVVDGSPVPSPEMAAEVPVEPPIPLREAPVADGGVPGPLLTPESSPATEMYAAGGASSTSMHGMAARSPAVAALRQKAALSRAMRPLKRTAASSTIFVVDECATAEQIAVDGLWIPVLRPAAERWLDLTLVIDTAASMLVWQRTIAEFRTLTERLGAFRRIRVVELDGDDTGLATVELESRIVPTSTDPATLIDPAERQTILVITDGVGGGWRSGRIQTYLERWAQHGSVAVATVLPQRMWAGTGLKVVAGQAWTWRPGVPNAHWTTRGGGAVPIPVLGLSARWFRPWAQLIAGTGGRHHTALLTAASRPRSAARAAAVRERSAVDIVNVFRTAASPTAFRLACYLSAAWLNLPVMRLVQHLMLPDSDVSHLAEVFLGGLLRRVGHPGTDPDVAQYEFVPGVRDELNNYLMRDELLTVAERSSEFVAERFGQAFDFAALLADPEGVELPAVMGEDGGMPLAHVSANVLAKLGGRYLKLSQRLTSTVPGAVSGGVTEPAAVLVEALEALGGSSEASAASAAEPAEAVRTTGGYFLGVAVDGAVVLPDLETIARRLGAEYSSVLSVDVPASSTREQLQSLRDNVPVHGSLVVYWHGPTEIRGSEASLLFGDGDSATGALPMSALVEVCTSTRAREVLLVLEVDNAIDDQRLGSTLNLTGEHDWFLALSQRSADPAGCDALRLLRDAMEDIGADAPATAREIAKALLRRWKRSNIERPFIFETSRTGVSNLSGILVDERPATREAVALAFDDVRDLLRAGDFAGAQDTAVGIRDIEVRSAALTEITAALADSGDIPRASIIPPTIPVRFHRARAFTLIAGAHARTGNKEAATRILIDARDVLREIDNQAQRSEVLHLIREIAEEIYGIGGSIGAEGIKIVGVYSQNDLADVIPLADMLGLAGAFIVFDADRPTHPSEERLGWLQSQCQEADVALLIATGNSIGIRTWQQDAGLLQSSRIATVPVVLGGLGIEEAEQWIEFPTAATPIVLDGVSPAAIAPIVAACLAAASDTSRDRPTQRNSQPPVADRTEVSVADDTRFDLRRFVHAQDGVYDSVLDELSQGSPRGHWIWFIFPQLSAAGRGPTPYGISSREEAIAYLAHPVLGPRLRECARALHQIQGRSIENIFNWPDHLKVRSSMTLFARIAADGLEFKAVLGKYFNGEEDREIVEMLATGPRTPLIYISYARADSKPVRQLANDCQRAGVDVWLDLELAAGAAWWQLILQRIRECTVFVFAVSAPSLTSRSCRVELEYAQALGLPILPVQIGQVASYRSHPIFRWQFLDYRDPTGLSALAMVQAVTELSSRRTPLPDPLPEQPLMPYEYLRRIATEVNSPAELSPAAQIELVSQLRTALSDEADLAMRGDIQRLLGVLRDRPEAIYRVATEIDELLGAQMRDIGHGPTPPASSTDEPPTGSLAWAAESMVMDQAAVQLKFDAFVSYARGDREVAAAIRKGLQRIGRRFGQLRALRVYFDETRLSANADTWGALVEAMTQTRYMVAVLSPLAAASPWVNEEISYWLRRRGPAQLLLVLADGRLEWDRRLGRFDPERSDAAPPVLTAPGALPMTPLFVDVSGDSPWDIKSPSFRHKVIAVAAPIHGLTVDELASRSR